MKRAGFTFAVLLSLSARAELVDRVAAVVNRDIIPLSDVEGRASPELQRLAAEAPDKRAERRADILKRALQQLVGEKLMEAQIRDFNIEVNDAEVDMGIEDVKKRNNIDDASFTKLLATEGYSVTSYKAFMKKQLARLKLINLKVRSKVKISDADIEGEYNRLAKLDSDDAEIHARHILIPVSAKATDDQVEAARKRAQAIFEEASKAGVSFAELAKKRIEGAGKEDGGDLGYFRRGTMVPEFEKVAFKMKAGDVAPPVRTRFGWHVIKIEDRRAVAPKALDEMKESIRERLTAQSLEKYTDQYVAELRASATVEEKL